MYSAALDAATVHWGLTHVRHSSDYAVAMETVNDILGTLSKWIWGAPMLILLVGTGVFLTARLRVLQVHKLPHALVLAFRKQHDDQPGDISRFQALMTALAATIGTGNVIGVAAAIALGGPGALFWMWITAFFGMATKYAEAILAVKYRVTDEKGEMCGGPMYYIERGLGQKWLAVLFAVFGACAAFGIGNMFQANAVAGSLDSTLGLSERLADWMAGTGVATDLVSPEMGARGLVGIGLAALTALVILGGIKRIGRITAWVVPVMAVVYILGCLVILSRYAHAIPGAVALVLRGAFTGTAASGGFAGAAINMVIRQGVARGVFSNESGLGSAPIAAAAAKTRVPAQQALVSMTGTFIDTIIVCSLTGLVLIVTGAWQSGVDKVAMTQTAFDAGLPGGGGGFIVSFGVIFFAYSTILGWAYYGEKCLEYLAGRKSVLAYRWLWVIAVAIGSTVKLDLVLNFADVMNGLMAFPNLVGLLGLSGVVVAETRHYLNSLKS